MYAYNLYSNYEWFYCYVETWSYGCLKCVKAFFIQRLSLKRHEIAFKLTTHINDTFGVLGKLMKDIDKASN